MAVKLFSQNLPYNTSLPKNSNSFEEFITESRQLARHYEILQKVQNNISSFFLTQEGEKRKNLIPKKLALENPELLIELENIQEQIFNSDQLNKLEQMIHYSNLLIKLSKIFIDKYEQHKNIHSLLDYDDLIYFTKILLTDSQARA